MSLITKIHLLVDAQGRPVRFSLTGGQRAYVSQAIPLLTGIETGAVIADKGYESNRVLAFIRDQGAEAVIPPKSNRRDPWEYDRELCRERNLIERAFNKLKQWRRIATRYDRRSLYFLSALHLVASVIWGLKLSIRPSITTTVQGGRPEAARRLVWEYLVRSLHSCVSSSHRSNLQQQKWLVWTVNFEVCNPQRMRG